MSPNNKGTIASRVMGVLFTLIAGVVVVNEGYKETAYKDSAGIWTICYGETNGVRKGDTATPSECSAQLAKSLESHSTALYGLPNSTPDVVLVGAIDMAYNVGANAFSNSAVKRYLVNSDYNAASKAVLDWKYISRYQTKNPGKGWVWNQGKRKWTYDCSQTVNGAPNKVCWGLWERRQWQSKAIGNGFKTPKEAVDALGKYGR